MEALLGETYPLRLGYTAVVCRSEQDSQAGGALGWIGLDRFGSMDPWEWINYSVKASERSGEKHLRIHGLDRIHRFGSDFLRRQNEGSAMEKILQRSMGVDQICR